MQKNALKIYGICSSRTYEIDRKHCTEFLRDFKQQIPTLVDGTAQQVENSDKEVVLNYENNSEAVKGQISGFIKVLPENSGCNPFLKGFQSEF